MSFINRIGVALPQYKHAQKDISKYMAACFGKAALIDRIYAETAIDYRYSVLPDFSPVNERTLFQPEKEASVDERMRIFFEEAPRLSVQAVKNTFEDVGEITHLITVSCTGLAAPGLEILLIKELGLKSNIKRHTVNFMGCYAAFHALRLADLICTKEKNARVAVVCTELCTLHFQQAYAFDSIAPAALFADGSACVEVSNREEGLRMLDFNSYLVPEAEQQMTWQVSESGFLMHLGTGIPDVIAAKVAGLFNSEEMKDVSWAIHPGGRKILDSFAEAVGLEKEQPAESYEVLRNYGNMSSATILFILKSMMEAGKTGKIMACGFGPGLSVETMLLQA